jgi:hypothetical protein
VEKNIDLPAKKLRTGLETGRSVKEVGSTPLVATA